MRDYTLDEQERRLIQKLSHIGTKGYGPITEESFYQYSELNTADVSFFKIEKLSFDEKYPHREAFENVLASFDSREFNFVYILQSENNGQVGIYIGVVKRAEQNVIGASDMGEIVQNAFRGNFSGSTLTKVIDSDSENHKDLSQLLNDTYKYIGAVTGVPAISEQSGENNFGYQGIDRLINSMAETENACEAGWRFVLVCEPVSREDIYAWQDEVFSVYEQCSAFSKVSVQKSENQSSQHTEGKNRSTQKGKNTNLTHSSRLEDDRQESKACGDNSSETSGTSESDSSTQGVSASVSRQLVNMLANEHMKYIEEELLPRIHLGLGRGLFRTSVYYMADDRIIADRLKACIISMFQGEHSTHSPLTAQMLPEKCSLPNTYRTPWVKNIGLSREGAALKSLPMAAEGTKIGLCTYMTSREVSLLAGIPQREVPGIPLREGVDFGLNLNSRSGNGGNSIRLGEILHRGTEIGIPFMLDGDVLNKHTFVAGVTGSGKTTTCHRLLREACSDKETYFLVIEPAKTEYRTLINQKEAFGDVIVFTLGNDEAAPFRLNPFELERGELLTAHVDMLKAAFTSAFPMEAAMPQLIEEAIYECYRQYGWDIDAGCHPLGDDAFDDTHNCFPILSDLLVQLEATVKSKKFSDRLGGDYIGSLVARFSHLTKASKGRMLNCFHSVDFKKLVKCNVVLELDEIKSPEDKALIMGFILTRLNAVVRVEHRENPSFRHITLVEEAHRLLSKVQPGDGGAKKASVEMFTDMLAEVRKYGEGLIIVDQIPGKLAAEVLKNTNTKIIHKLLARDDKEAVGDTMLMDERQKEYLSALRVGETVIFSGNTDKPVNVKIEKITDTSEEEIPDKDVAENFKNIWLKGNPGAYKWDGLSKLCRRCTEISFHSISDEDTLRNTLPLIRELDSEIQSEAGQIGVTPDEMWRKVMERQYRNTSSYDRDTLAEMVEKAYTCMMEFTNGKFPEDYREKYKTSLKHLGG